MNVRKAANPEWIENVSLNESKIFFSLANLRNFKTLINLKNLNNLSSFALDANPDSSSNIKS